MDHKSLFLAYTAPAIAARFREHSEQLGSLIEDVAREISQMEADAGRIRGDGRLSSDGKRDRLRKLAADAVSRVDGLMGPAIRKWSDERDNARQTVDERIRKMAGADPGSRAATFMSAIQQIEGWLAEHVAELRPGEAAALLVAARGRRYVTQTGQIREMVPDALADRLRSRALPNSTDIERAATLHGGLQRFGVTVDGELDRIFGRDRPDPPLPSAAG